MMSVCLNKKTYWFLIWQIMIVDNVWPHGVDADQNFVFFV
jgi:hypothetical protein